ncbi:MAG: TIM barrel protein [Verrucomicrobiota bacterium]
MKRRELIKNAIGAAGIYAIGAEVSSAQEKETSGQLKQAFAHWCMAISPEKWTLEQSCQNAKKLGLDALDLLSTEEELEVAKKHGLITSLVGMDMAPDPPFVKGFNNPKNWDHVIERTKNGIDLAVKYGSPNMICFTGFKYHDPFDPQSGEIDFELGANNTVAGIKKVIGYAEKKKINLCIEPLNSRVSDHPMKGHPGYQGDRMDYCMDIVKSVGSERMKVLFDIYHTQIMDGDIIVRLKEYFPYIAHIHTAGNPGRQDFDETQEINYKPMFKLLADLGYSGYVSHEFLPKGDQFKALQKAIEYTKV